jgi:hypothetical protein
MQYENKASVCSITHRKVTRGRAGEEGGFISSRVSPLVLADILQVATTHDNGALHLGGHDNTLKDAAANRDVASERALLVNIGAINGSLRGFESQTDRFGPSSILDALIDATTFLCANENSILLLKGLFGLVECVSHGACEIDGDECKRLGFSV